MINAEKLDEAYKIRSAFELYVVLCLFKYLTSKDYQFFGMVHQHMNDLVQACGTDCQGIIPEYLELDHQLHERFVIRGDTQRMVQLFQQMNIHLQMRWIVPRYQAREFDAIHFEHEQIFTALDSETPEYLSASLLNHLEASRMRALKHAH